MAFQYLEPWAKALAGTPHGRLLGHKILQAQQMARMPLGPSGEEGGRGRGGTGCDLGGAKGMLGDKPWTAAFVHGGWGRMGMKSMQVTSQTPFTLMHLPGSTEWLPCSSLVEI